MIIALYFKENESVYMTNTITVQGEQVFVGNRLFSSSEEIFLPMILSGD